MNTVGGASDGVCEAPTWEEIECAQQRINIYSPDLARALKTAITRLRLERESMRLDERADVLFQQLDRERLTGSELLAVSGELDSIHRRRIAIAKMLDAAGQQ